MKNYKHLLLTLFVIASFFALVYLITKYNSNHNHVLQEKQYIIDSLSLELKYKDSIINNLFEFIPLGSPLKKIEISSAYGSRRNPINRRWQFHNGIDLKKVECDTVYSTGGGEVIFSGWNGGYGRCVKVYHGNEYETMYAHLRKFLIKKGEEISDKQPIGIIGSSGRSTGTHLHYEIIKNGKNINPEKYIINNEF
jgi:murein DD-endopeptidase MepM/ murein hydrolase activator NlpD